MFARLIKRFARDERGVFMVIFAVMAIALTAMAGAAVDYVQVDQVRSRSQIALDAAALALQPEIYQSGKSIATIKSELKATAQELLSEQITDPGVTATVDAIDINQTDGQLFLRAELTVPLAFVALVGMDEMTTQIISQVTRKKLNLEVVFVLDNSGSMGNSWRLTNLKSAATCATNIIFYGSCNPPWGATKDPNTVAGIIPFTSFVNVGDDYENASWMDQTGAASISNDNFDNDDNENTDFNGPVDRFDLYDNLDNVSWEGCVEARKYPYSVNDTEPTLANPDTLFTPVFQPDEPDGWNGSYLSDEGGSCSAVNTESCVCIWFDQNTPVGRWECAILNEWGGVVSNGDNVCNCTSNAEWHWDVFNLGWGSGTQYTCPGGNSLTDRELQERLCKYDGWANVSGTRNPNGDCPATEVLPLTNNANSVKSRISSMVANGNTNIHQGVIWGFHALSPTEPLTEGRDYDTATSKVMIVMTDGENVFNTANNMNGSNILQAYGYYYNTPPGGTAYQKRPGSRLGYGVTNSSQMNTIMNKLTEESCDAAKAAHIQIYTIGLNPPNTATRQMLTNCASLESMAYFPNEPSELNDVFSTIAEQLAELRIER